MRKKFLVIGAVIASALAGCASAPQTRQEGQALEANATGTLDSMRARDPSLDAVLARAAGYVVFPEVAEGGFIVGGNAGVGVVYEHNQRIGYSELRGGSVGLQAGGQSYSQVVVFETPAALARFKAGNFDMSASVTATAVQMGAAANARFEDGVIVLVDDQSGLMAGASVQGQNLSFTENRPSRSEQRRQDRR